MAVRLSQAGQWAQAESLFRQIVSACPNDAQSHDFCGWFLASRDEAQAAYQSYDPGVRLSEKFAEALSNLGELRRLSGRIDEAIALLQRAVSLRPEFVEAHFNLALALADQNHFDEAIDRARQAQRFLPQSAEVHNLLGNLLREADRVDEALEAYRKALELRPDFAEARWHLALALLVKGQYEEGWQAYESRWQLRSVWHEPGFSQPLWDGFDKLTAGGSDLAGRRILLWAEQGFGDTIQFVRYAPLVRERGGRVVLLCQPELGRLMQSQTDLSLDEVISFGQPLPEFQVQCPLLSLPRIFKTTLTTVPARVPYLQADSILAAAWKARMKPGRKNIGLVWATKPAVPGADSRSIGLGALTPLANVPGVTFWSLQKGDAAGEARAAPANMELIDCSAELNDFADTAALIANLDLVIVGDSAVAHLAGELGVPGWIILPRPSPWRWMQDRADSPWYPMARLFRQQRAGNWAGPVARVAHELTSLL